MPEEVPGQKTEPGLDEAWGANIKQMFDEFKQKGLTESGRCDLQFHQMFDTTQRLGAQIAQNAVTQANLLATNAITSADLAMKQAIEHSRFGIDRIWNPDEVAQLTSVFAKALSGAPPFNEVLAKILSNLANSLSPKSE